MKSFLLTLSILLFTQTYSQEVMKIKDADEKFGIFYLDSIYQSGIHVDSSQAVFKNQKEYYEAYLKMFNQLMNFFKENDFVFEKPVSGFNKIYFNGDGTIKYFFYSIKKDQISEAQEIQFEKILKDFAKNYQFSLQADTGFRQCGSVTYKPQE
jgi:hypothetical protein